MEGHCRSPGRRGLEPPRRVPSRPLLQLLTREVPLCTGVPHQDTQSFRTTFVSMM